MNRTATVILTTALLTILGTASLSAEESAIATVPFAFHVQNQTMPAGRYTVKPTTMGLAASFSISDKAGHSRFVGAPLLQASNPEDPKLVFACSGGECYLVTIALPGSNVSHSLVRSNANHNLGMSSMISVRVTH